MRTIQIGKHRVELFDSIDELPIVRFHKFNKYTLVDAGIGSDLNDIDNNLLRVVRHIDRSELDKAKIQVQNLRQSLFNISQGLNIKHLSFMILVYKIDGKEVFDISDENLKKIQKKFQCANTGFINKILESVKKKLEDELNVYFPGQFDDTSIKEYYEKFKNRILLQLDTFIRGNNNTKTIQEIEDFLLALARPKIFFGKENLEIRYDKQFEEMCLFLKHELSVDTNNMTVLQFYNSFEYIKKLKHGNKSNKIQ